MYASVARQQSGKSPDLNTEFKQQRLQTFSIFNLTPYRVVGVFLFFGVLFLILGGVLLQAANKVVVVEKRYDDICGSSPVCNISLDISQEMKPPIFFYYKLVNFYQNHRSYARSRSDPQLRNDPNVPNLDTCKPLDRTNNKNIYPCGLIAYSFFNDRYDACVSTSPDSCDPLSGSNWKKDGIAWPSDLRVKFKSRPLDMNSEVPMLLPQNTTLDVPVTDEDFVVWMRVAGLPTFKKLHRKITDRTLPAGSQLQLTVQNRFNVTSFNGQKSVILSTLNWAGGQNYFLGWAFVVCGIFITTVALVLGIAFQIAPRYQ